MKMGDQEFEKGDVVEKHNGDYYFEGIVVSAFQKLSGAWRYAVENEEGIVMIMNSRQLERKE